MKILLFAPLLLVCFGLSVARVSAQTGFFSLRGSLDCIRGSHGSYYTLISESYEVNKRSITNYRINVKGRASPLLSVSHRFGIRVWKIEARLSREPKPHYLVLAYEEKYSTQFLTGAEYWLKTAQNQPWKDAAASICLHCTWQVIY